jgi:hypothetical protein
MSIPAIAAQPTVALESGMDNKTASQRAAGPTRLRAVAVFRAPMPKLRPTVNTISHNF